MALDIPTALPKRRYVDASEPPLPMMYWTRIETMAPARATVRLQRVAEGHPIAFRVPTAALDQATWTSSQSGASGAAPNR